jgi:DNA primase
VTLLGSFVAEVVKLAGSEDKRWHEVIIETPLRSLTKKDVFNYYNEPKVRKAMLAETAGREVIVRQNFTPDFVVLKRKENGEFIRFEKDKVDVNDPKDASYFAERRMTEFHPVLKDKESQLIVDLDPKPGFPFRDTKAYASQVAELVKTMPGVTGTKIRYSGGRGFYVIGQLSEALDVDVGRKALKQVLAPLLELDERLTLGVPDSDDQMRLDVTPFKRRGSIRGAYSLNASTGLVSVPVQDLDAFDPKEHATMEAVLGRKTREFVHVR